MVGCYPYKSIYYLGNVKWKEFVFIFFRQNIGEKVYVYIYIYIMYIYIYIYYVYIYIYTYIHKYVSVHRRNIIYIYKNHFFNKLDKKQQIKN